MLKTFFKVQSLGNDFLLFDWFEKKESERCQIVQNPAWKNFVAASCNRNFGVGADGVLILIKNQNVHMPQAFIFNADGSQAELCLNGLRCIAHHLYTNQNFPQNFTIKMGDHIIACKIIAKDNTIEIRNEISPGLYVESKPITILHQTFTGHIVDVGNPHFLIFQNRDLEYLKKYGSLIENNHYFKNKTNVEFVWQENKKNHFNMLIYERGCGITLACSSGACALVSALFHLNKIKTDETITICMPGGTVSCWIDKKNKKINLQAQAKVVFKGELSQSLLKFV